jgi:hypothetical protein
MCREKILTASDCARSRRLRVAEREIGKTRAGDPRTGFAGWLERRRGIARLVSDIELVHEDREGPQDRPRVCLGLARLQHLESHTVPSIIQGKGSDT